MSRKPNVWATCYGLVYSFSPRSWVEMLEKIANGESVDYDAYGNIVRQIDTDITDLDAEEAANQLKSYKEG